MLTYADACRLARTLVKVLWSLSAAMSLFMAFIFVAAVLMLQFVSGKLSQCVRILTYADVC
jgi:hypothetical protein